MLLEMSNCYKRGCKHYQGIKKNGKIPVNYCKAYPEGIPRDIAYGENDHSEKQKGQTGSFVFTEDSSEKKELEEDLHIKGGPGSGSWDAPGRPRYARSIRQSVDSLNPKKRSSAIAALRAELAKRGVKGNALKEDGKPKAKPKGKPEKTNIGLTPQRPMQPTAGDDNYTEQYKQWEKKTNAAQDKTSISSLKKSGVVKVVVENGANGSHVDVCNKALDKLSSEHPYVKDFLAKNKIDEFQVNGDKLLDGDLVGFYAEGILMMSKKGVDMTHQSMQNGGMDVVFKSALKSGQPFSCSNAVAHEIAHHMYNNDKKITEGFIEAWKKHWKKERKNKNFTHYGSTEDEEEGFAEAFALYTHPEGRKRLLPETTAFMEWYLKEGKKKKGMGLEMFFKGGPGSGIRGHRTARNTVPAKRTKIEEDKHARSMEALKSRGLYRQTFAQAVKREMGSKYKDSFGRTVTFSGKEHELRNVYYVWQAHIRFALANGVKVPDKVLQDSKKRSARRNVLDSYNPKKYIAEEIIKVGTARSGNYGHEGIRGHRGGSKPTKRGRVTLDRKIYVKLSAADKVKALRSCLNSYKECYTPKVKQRRILNKLSSKGQKEWMELNRSIGKMEGMRRAYISRGDSFSRVEQRKYYHAAIKFQEMVDMIRKDMKALK